MKILAAALALSLMGCASTIQKNPDSQANRMHIAKNYVAIDCSWKGTPARPVMYIVWEEFKIVGEPANLLRSEQAKVLLGKVLADPNHDKYIDPYCKTA